MMSKKISGRVVIAGVLILVLLGVLACAALVLVFIPLGKPLIVAVRSATGTPEATATGVTRLPTKTPVRGVATPARVATEEPVVTYMVLGIDVDHQAEAIYLMTTDPANNSVTIVAYAPSLQVNVKGLEALGISKTDFKMVYFNALNLPGGDAASATNLMAQTLADNFGVVPDHYLSMSENDLAAQIDAIGGIDVNVPAKFRDFQAGQQHLDGTATWHYVAAIDQPGVELEVPRIERQRQVLQAILKKFASAAIVPRIPNMVQVAVQGKIVKTDLSVRQILTLVNFLQHVPDAHIHFTDWNQ
jgi:polyisoprenyl-teichoic acid--peptidoglycan teichoic acid transferase